MKIDAFGLTPPGQAGTLRAADQLESAFLAEMLKIAMPDPGAGAFGGGIGESQFSSFLVEQHAAVLASRLDLGLTDRLGADHA